MRSAGRARRRSLKVLLGAFAVGTALAGVARADGAKGAAKPGRYEFRIREVKGDVDDATRTLTRQVLLDELKSRPEFVEGDPGAPPPASAGLRRFDVSLKMEELTQTLEAPRPGGRLKQLAVRVRLSVFGTEIPTEKLAFGGDGESTIQAEVVERRLKEESAPVVKEALERAVKSAVDEAVAKLSMPRVAPLNESKRRKRAK